MVLQYILHQFCIPQNSLLPAVISTSLQKFLQSKLRHASSGQRTLIKLKSNLKSVVVTMTQTCTNLKAQRKTTWAEWNRLANEARSEDLMKGNFCPEFIYTCTSSADAINSNHSHGRRTRNMNYYELSRGFKAKKVLPSWRMTMEDYNRKACIIKWGSGYVTLP